MKLSSFAKGVTGTFEAVLAIPFFGGLMVVMSGWQLLTIALILHIVTAAIAIANRTSVAPSVLGIVTSIVAFIPIVGWFLHAITAICLYLSAYRDSRHEAYHR
ncbi:hypothetical protein [Ureibacillus manganicus]|uniref:Uncharacterized protein n=1 Tax=Ureibacillus manganicus DSM 26584 TaxID=1384049 RepID=A0A0A3HLT3_9BACL|nr:hypothetical protein [Ureibacillus manganicus]KGR73536.1 hypothetical protein CD29_19835 [Ureibacillus manganicus DSM 26584]